MAFPWSHDFAGRLDQQVIDSPALVGNPLGDPHERPLWVYLPPGYDDDPGRRYPSVYVLQGYTGHVAMWNNRTPFRRPFPELLDEAMARGECPPCIVAYVDAWTALGGSQFVDSPGTGRYHTYLCDDVVPWVDGRYRTLADAAHRGVAGKSSGGFGAMITPMLRPDLFGGLASHAGDALYEYCYLPFFPGVVRALRDTYDGSIDRFLDDFGSRVAMTRPDDDELISTYAVAACFSADDDGRPRLPFDATTGRLDDDLWARWLAWDPVRMAPAHAEALAGLRGVYLDAGRADEYHLDLGADAMRRELEAAGVADIRFELFDGGHSAIEHRYPSAIAYLATRLGE
jgi:hypothetical protein